MSGVSKINYKGFEILYIDYRGQSEDQMIMTLKETESILLNENKKWLSLTNMTNVYFTPKFTAQANQHAIDIKHIKSKSAIIGIVGVKKILLENYLKLGAGQMVAFETEEEAKEYLIMP